MWPTTSGCAKKKSSLFPFSLSTSGTNRTNGTNHIIIMMTSSSKHYTYPSIIIDMTHIYVFVLLCHMHTYELYCYHRCRFVDSIIFFQSWVRSPISTCFGSSSFLCRSGTALLVVEKNDHAFIAGPQTREETRGGLA